jgi:hypothetical protein
MTISPGRTSRDPDKDIIFLAILAAGSSVSAACRAAGYARSSAYHWRKTDADFAQDWAQAREEGTDLLEDEALRRASVGVEKPVYYQGQKIGVTHDPSDRLMIFLLQARRPDIYRDRLKKSATDNAKDAPDLSQLAADFDARIDRLINTKSN